MYKLACCANTTFIIDNNDDLLASGENRFGQIDCTLKEYNSFKKLGKYKSISANSTSICKIDLDNVLSIQGRINKENIPNVKKALVTQTLAYIDTNDILHYISNEKEYTVENVKDFTANITNLYYIDSTDKVYMIDKKTNIIKDLKFKAKKIFCKYDNFGYIDEDDYAWINGIKTIKASKIQFGYDFTIVLDLENTVYFKGSAKYEQVPDIKYSKELQKTSIKAKDIACGTYHIAYIDLDNILITRGYNYNGQLGIKFGKTYNKTDIVTNLTISKSIKTPKTVKSLKTPKTVKTQKTNIIDTDEVLKQLNTISKNIKADYTKTLKEILNKIENISSKEPIKKQVKISTGNNFSALIDKDNNLYLKGKNTYGQLDKNLEEFTKQNIKVKDVSCGFGHILLIDLEDNLWVRGMNYYGQLGIGNTDHQNKFINTKIKVQYIKAGNWNSFIIKKDGLIYEAGIDIGNTFRVSSKNDKI